MAENSLLINKRQLDKLVNDTMKVLIIVDKIGSAIHRLSVDIARNLPHLDIVVAPLHPKRPDIDQIEFINQEYKDTDILHIAYWKSGEKLKEFIDIKDKTKLLCHYNPYDVDKEEINKQYDMVVVGNKTMHTIKAYARHIPYGVNLDFWRYNEKYDTGSKRVCMVVARIEGKKGVLEVAQACRALGYTFTLVGRISDQDYFQRVMIANPETEFHENISDEQLREVYYNSALHVCNSVDNFESGTLPILEAMACGVPVMTRIVGHVPELYDGQNLHIYNGSPEDIPSLQNSLEDIMKNTALREKMRDKSWNTIKNWDTQHMAIRFESVYYKLVHKETDLPFVSIIIPTKDRQEVFTQNLMCCLGQSYPFIEIVVVDSGKESVEKIVNTVRTQTTIPIKYLYLNEPDSYTLPKARNLGVIESSGDLLVFCDERQGMFSNAVEEFVNAWSPKTWLWGVKDEVVKGFVENFSCVSRIELVRAGMFNERVDLYGGATQEISERFNQQKFQFEFVGSAKAKTLCRSHSRASRRDSIRKAKLLLFKMYRWRV